MFKSVKQTNIQKQTSTSENNKEKKMEIKQHTYKTKGIK